VMGRPARPPCCRIRPELSMIRESVWQTYGCPNYSLYSRNKDDLG
jgi:hypothetical protein